MREFLVILVAVAVFVIMFAKFRAMDDRVYVTAFDGRKYMVRNIKNKKDTADALARLNKRIEELFVKLEKEADIKYKPAVARLKERFIPESVSEGPVDRDYTSYTINKGEKVVFCMRSRDNKDEIYDDNLIFYVALHELSHIASITEGHNDEFHDNFKYLIKKATDYGLFKNQVGGNYCGIDLGAST